MHGFEYYVFTGKNVFLTRTDLTIRIIEKFNHLVITNIFAADVSHLFSYLSSLNRVDLSRL
jgi:hypothetical protein